MNEKQQQIIERINSSADKSIEIAVRALFNAFGFSRRTSNNNICVDRFLEEHKLEVSPHYNSVWIDNEIKIGEKKKATRKSPIDPIKRIEVLESANRKPTVINNDAELCEAVTIMMRDNFSQLPVVTGPNSLRGYISWETIGTALANGVKSHKVKDYIKENVKTLPSDTPLLKAVRTVYKHDFVVVMGKDKSINGIITTTDISSQFLAFTEPFLLIEEIENQIRRLLDGKLHLEEVQKLCSGDDGRKKTVEHLDDLTFGDYIVLMQNQDLWNKLGFSTIHRPTLVKLLDRIREIRNDLMHFEPAGIDPQNQTMLQQTCELLQKIAKYHCAE